MLAAMAILGATKSMFCAYFMVSVVISTPGVHPTAIKNSTDTAKALGITSRDTSVNAASNLSAILPPREFTCDIDSSSGSTNIREYGVFATTLKAFFTLVKESPNWQSQSSITIRVPKYPGVALRLSGPHQGAFEASYIIWGLTIAIKYMVDCNESRNWKFILRWRGQYVGMVWFVDESPQEGPEATFSSNATSLHLNDAATNTVATFTIDDIAGPALELKDVMMVIVGGFTDIAYHAPTDLIPDSRFTTAFEPYRAMFDLNADDPSVYPAWFTYLLVNSALEAAGKYYLRDERIAAHRPVLITISIERHRVGLGSILPHDARLIEIGRSGGERNISTA